MDKKYIEARTLRGFHDKLPKEAILKNKMIAVLRQVFESFGFVPIETPHLEYTEVLIGDASAEIEKQLFRFKDQGDRDVCLRFDLTVPLARFISQHKDKVGVPFKRWAVGSAFRGETPQAGRYREFTQCDFDIIGTTSVAADAEIVQVIGASMEALNVKDYVVKVNSRRLMNGLAKSLNVEEKSAAIIQIVDKIDKIGKDEVQRQLAEQTSPEQAQKIADFISTGRGEDPRSVIQAASRYPHLNGEMEQALKELSQLTEIVKAAGMGDASLSIDYSIARGFGYYTGIVYETFLGALPKFGSICSGGRYDNLTQTFRPEPMPGVGASVGLDRLIAGLETLGLLAGRGTTAQALILPKVEEDLAVANTIAGELRKRGLCIEVFPEAAELKKQIAYAQRAGHPAIVKIEKREPLSLLVNDLQGQRKQSFPGDAKGLDDLAGHIRALQK